MKIGILGCGPAGLMAAHAAFQEGHDIQIYSKMVRSELYGAMYLHRSIPDITNGPDFRLQIVKEGNAETYAQKVYGKRDHPVSFNEFEAGRFPAWDLRAAYGVLWQRYWTAIDNVEVDYEFVWWLAERHDLIFSTIPAKILCVRDEHEFKSQPIWVLHGEDPDLMLSEHIMIYNGCETPSWYRYSQFDHYQSWEYGHAIKAGFYRSPPFKITQGIKPISTDCTCPPPNVIRVGRFGAWEKGCLTHHAYERTREVLRAL